MIRFFPIFIIGFFTVSCSTSGPKLFKKQSLHEEYATRIDNAGLRNTTLGKLWFIAAEKTLLNPATITLPFRETGYFPAENPDAAGWQFLAKRGEKLTIQLSKKPLHDFILYLELFEFSGKQGGRPTLLVFADTSGKLEPFEIKRDGKYILRLQPELLRGGEYTLSITTGPSLSYPIRASGKNHIQSFWGAARDLGTRKHEGIDLFAPFRTTIVAAAHGYITKVQETDIGGKVVWLRPMDKDYSIYYAHLDSQLVQEGRQVREGDPIGLMGNTGNARHTAAHLHFGIYGRGGAIDPFPFVNPEIKSPPPIKGDSRLVGKWIRHEGIAGKLYNSPDVKVPDIPLPPFTLFRNKALHTNWFYVMLPDGRSGFLPAERVDPANTPYKKIKLTQETAILDKPDSLAARKTTVPAGSSVQVFGNFNGFYYIKIEPGMEGWIHEKKN